MRCCICGKLIAMEESNNPSGAVWRTEGGEIEEPEFGPEDRCCDECNLKYVIPGRVYRLNKARKAKEGEGE